VRKQWETYKINNGILEKGSPPPDGDNDYPKHQSKAGQGSGLSMVLNPEINEYFCSGHDSYGFRVSLFHTKFGL